MPQSYLALNYAPYQATASPRPGAFQFGAYSSLQMPSQHAGVLLFVLFGVSTQICLLCWQDTRSTTQERKASRHTLSRARDMRPSAGLVAYPQLSPSKGTNTTENSLLPQPRSTLDLAELIQNDPVPRSTMRVILGAVIHMCADKNDSRLEPPATKPIFASWAENNEGQGAGRRHMTRNL